MDCMRALPSRHLKDLYTWTVRGRPSPQRGAVLLEDISSLNGETFPLWWACFGCGGCFLQRWVTSEREERCLLIGEGWHRPLREISLESQNWASGAVKNNVDWCSRPSLTTCKNVCCNWCPSMLCLIHRACLALVLGSIANTGPLSSISAAGPHRSVFTVCCCSAKQGEWLGWLHVLSIWVVQLTAAWHSCSCLASRFLVS